MEIITHHMVCIVDGESIRAEFRNRDAENFSESVGLMIYSNRKTSVDSFKSIFELLGTKATSNEEAKKSSRNAKRIYQYSKS